MNRIDMDANEKKYLKKLEWLKQWGSFKTNEEVSIYPWCMVDVMSIMDSWYRYEVTRNRKGKKRR
jgi:hypothetical protein